MGSKAIPYYYLCGALVALLLTYILPTWPLKIAFGWTCIALALIASAYWLNTARLFRKKANGRIPWYIRWSLIPFLIGVRVYNAIARRQDDLPVFQKVADGIYVGRRLFSGDLKAIKDVPINAVLDVTAEFDALDWSAERAEVNYLNVPVLDHLAPSHEQIHQALQWIHEQQRQGHNVLIHCALGRGRSVFMAAAYLLAHSNTKNIDDVMKKIQGARKVARLNHQQKKALQQFIDEHQELMIKRAYIVANPVSGGGKWSEYAQPLKDTLTPYFELTVIETKEDKNGTECAREALEQGAELVIACGGDGTLTEVARALIGHDCKMAIVPMGTANSLSQVLWGLSSKLSPVDVACETIIEGRCRQIDCGWVNEQLMLLCAGVGFEQQMIEQADRSAKDKLGQLAYIQGLWRALSEDKQLQLHVTIDDGETETWETASLIVANAAPMTTLLAQGDGEPVIDDGKLDVTWLDSEQGESSPVKSLIELLYASITEEQVGMNTHHTRIKRIHLARCDGERLDYVVDGEPYSADELDIKVEKHALQILVPDRIDY